MAAQMPTERVLTVLEQELTLRQRAPGLAIHTKQGSQYTSHTCRQRLEEAGALTSYIRPGNSYGNIQSEADWSMLKTEIPSQEATFARLEVTNYLDTSLNFNR